VVQQSFCRRSALNAGIPRHNLRHGHDVPPRIPGPWQLVPHMHRNGASHEGIGVSSHLFKESTPNTKKQAEGMEGDLSESYVRQEQVSGLRVHLPLLPPPRLRHHHPLPPVLLHHHLPHFPRLLAKLSVLGIWQVNWGWYRFHRRRPLIPSYDRPVPLRH